MASFIELIAKIKQKNNGDYPLVDAEDIECEDGKRLNVVLNEKLDKNQGVENAGKTMVVGADGNLVVGDSSPKNVYTKEEVNYLLDDKMDKPYFDVAITDDTTIENTLAGNFKMDSIEGNIYQAEESGIVPTPERPIPIRSKKITVDGEIVELRSLKESKNVLDMYFYYSAGYSRFYDSSAEYNNGILTVTNKNTEASGKITFKDFSSIGLSIDNTKDIVLSLKSSGTFGTDVNATLIGKDSNGAWKVNSRVNTSGYATMTSAQLKTIVDLFIQFEVVSFAESEQQTFDFYDIQLEYGTTNTTYVPPTVRDYKIVDHTTKTSKIVRNTFELLLTGAENWKLGNVFGDLPQYFYLPTQYVSDISNDIKNTHFKVENPYTLNEDCLGFFVRDVRIRYEKYNGNIEGLKQWLSEDNVKVFGKLQTPTEESIPYVETDTSEVGLSWQDSTSPSPDIESKIYEVDEINIKTVGENILTNDTNEWQIGKSISWDATQETHIQIINSNHMAIIKINNIKPSTLYSFKNENTQLLWLDRIIEMNEKDLGVVNHNLYRDVSTNNKSEYSFTTNKNTNYIYIRVRTLPESGNGLSTPITDENILSNKISFGQGTISKYTPYQETSIQHTLSKPLRATKDGSVRDIIDIVNMQTIYNMLYLRLTKDLNWAYLPSLDQTKKNFFKCILSYNINKKNSFDGVSNYFPMDNPYQIYDMDCFSCYTLQNDIRVRLDRVDSVAEFKQWLDEKEVYVLLPLAEPTTEPLEDELVQKLKTLKTFSLVTHVFITGIAKPKLNAKYPKDIALAQQQLEAKVITLQEAVIKNV